MGRFKVLALLSILMVTVLSSCGVQKESTTNEPSTPISIVQSGVVVTKTGSSTIQDRILQQDSSGNISENSISSDSGLEIGSGIFSNIDFSIDFSTGYNDKAYDKTIFFRPKEVKHNPYPEDIQTYFDYVFKYSQSMNLDEVLDSIKGNFNKKPRTTKIGEFVTIEYVDEGECSNPTMILMGKRFNYRLFPVCYGEKSKEATFKYLEKIAGSLKEFDSKNSTVSFSEAQPLVLGSGFLKTKLYAKNGKLYSFVVNDEERLVGDWNDDFKTIGQDGYFSMGGNLYFVADASHGPMATIRSDSKYELYPCVNGIDLDGTFFVSGKKQDVQFSGKLFCFNSDFISALYDDSGVYILEIPSSGKLKYFPGMDGKSLRSISEDLVGDVKGNKLRSTCGPGGCEYSKE